VLLGPSSPLLAGNLLKARYKYNRNTRTLNETTYNKTTIGLTMDKEAVRQNRGV
jgi:hypothetical protein